jgi:hypothetical protein
MMSAMSFSFWLSARSFDDVPVAGSLPPDDGRYHRAPAENHLFVSGKLLVQAEL